MTYAWEKNKALTQKFSTGDIVSLNPAWSAYAYLKREFGHLFPAKVHSVSGGDVVRIGRGKAESSFAAQTLTKGW